MTLERGSPYIIAELGANHEGSLDKAKFCIEEAKEGGASAIKFQCYKANRLVSLDCMKFGSSMQSQAEAQFAYLKKYDAWGMHEYRELLEFCKNVGLDFFATPFDEEFIDELAEFGDELPFYKIASGDLNCIPLLRKIASKNKPVILSTGAGEISEIALAVDTLKKNGATEISLLHCVMNYPCKEEELHLHTIKILQNFFPELRVGYSDHSLADEEMLNLTTAFLLGAEIIEKHFTFDKNFLNNDHAHSMDKRDLKKFVKNIKKIQRIMGVGDQEANKEKTFLSSRDSLSTSLLSGVMNHKKIIHPIERKILVQARRSIVINKDLRKNSQLQEADLTYKRPALGISVVDWDKVIQKKINKDLKKDHILVWDDLE